MLTVNMEPKKSKTNESTKSMNTDNNGNVNEAFQKVGDQRIKVSDNQQVLSNSQRGDDKVDVGTTIEPTKNYYEHDIQYIDAERQTQDYSNGQHYQRDLERYREVDMMTKEKFNDDRRSMYQGHEIVLRATDEDATPSFPTTRNKIINPSVKIMRIDRDDDHFDNHGR